MAEFAGRVASPGIALGFAHRADRPRPDAPITVAAGTDPALLVIRAFDAVAERLAALAVALREDGRAEQADIMEVNGYIALDPDLRGTATRHAAEGLPADVAIREAVDEYAAMLAALDDPTLAERATDVRQVGRRALAWLADPGEADTHEARHGGGSPAADGGPGGAGGGQSDGISAGRSGGGGQVVVLIAEEVGAADLLMSDCPVVAALSVKGGPNSHAAIVARSMSIPLLTGVDPALLDLPDGTELLVDARARGVVRSHPPAREREAALTEMAEARDRRAAYAAERYLACETRDGHPIVLRANVATAQDGRAVSATHADGVGLLRTELPFLEAAHWPTQAEHTKALAPIMSELAGMPVTVRTLDFADDKLPPFLTAGREGRRLGRGLPLMLAEPEAFADQFRAVLTVAPADADLRVMIPMVAGLDELRSCRELLLSAASSLGVAAPPLGVMIELPEAVAAVDALAAEAAFLSIGSNDLTSQVLGLDRRDPAATPRMTAHPRVLAAISEVVRAAHGHGRQVSVCGDAAADPVVMPLLVGLGCDILSVAPAAVDEIRYRVRRLDLEACRSIAARSLECETAEQVWKLVREAG
ncbi:putative PEP-binding protein [Sphaerisporangium fuscum]|uniref:putative PEP-binding protein n=1 Tax=Sphaerisporangium fuscum TaxID=2835868 RepID=UPI002029A87D|nr:putative PEP-binding protein [Sphaerisporangium fuscum]